MSSTNSEVVVQRMELQPLFHNERREYPVIIMYRNHNHSATVTVKGETNGSYYQNQGPDIFLSLQVTRSHRYDLAFKLEVENIDKTIVFSFLGQWQIKAMNKIVNLTLLKSKHPDLPFDNGTQLTLVISLGPWDQLNKPKIETIFKTKVETKFIPDVTPMESLKAMLDKGVLADVVIKTEGTQFPCHKVVLAASSEVFRAMFETEMKESKQQLVDLTEVYDADTIRDVLHYLYTKQTPPKIDKTARTLLVAADYFQLAALKDLCVVILCKVIVVDTAAEILQLAENYNADVLKTTAVNFILDNYKNVMATPGWKSIPDQMAKSLISTIVNIAGSLKMNN